MLLSKEFILLSKEFMLLSKEFMLLNKELYINITKIPVKKFSWEKDITGNWQLKQVNLERKKFSYF